MPPFAASGDLSNSTLTMPEKMGIILSVPLMAVSRSQTDVVPE
jgi:hypothetical protein